MPSIVVVGSSNTDLVVRAPRIPSPGETILGGNLEVVPGGKGANQAVAAARLGAAVTFVARIGTDAFGDRSIEGFRREGIDVRAIRRDPTRPSGAALIVVAEDGRNAIVVAPGSNAALSPEDVEAAADAIRAADVLVVQLETPVETVVRALDIARGSGVTTILNPAPARPLGRDVLALADWLTPNETEAASLSGLPVRSMADAEAAARALRAQGAGGVIVTLGAEGALAVWEGGTLHVPAPRVAAVDTVAAGDAFNGALAVAFGEGRGMAAAIWFACAAGTASVTRRGAQPSLPTRDEVEVVLARTTESGGGAVR